MNGNSRYAGRVACIVSLLAGANLATAQVGTVQSEQKISETQGGFEGDLGTSDNFGLSIATLGDLDNDGNEDLAVGTRSGTLWILFLNTDGTVASEASINATSGGFGGVLAPGDWFGWSVSSLGDLDGDGNEDVAVGAPGDDDGGAVWILFLNANGTVASEMKISATAGGFGGHLDAVDLFGGSVASLGDLDSDGNQDLAVGAFGDDGGTGAVWILFLNADGTVASEMKIGLWVGGFSGVLDSGDFFGASVARLGDLDNDGNQDLAVGAYRDDDGATDQGAVWVLFMNPDGTVASQSKISATTGGFGGVLDPDDFFGYSVSSLGDLNGDGRVDLAVGAYRDDDGGSNQGAVWLLFLEQDGTVASQCKVSETEGGLGSVLDPNDAFGISAALLGDLNGDGNNELAVGAYEDDDGGSGQGAIWILSLEGDTTPPVLNCPSFVAVIDSKNGPFGDFVSFTVTASDDHDASPSVVCTPPSGSFFPRGTTIVTCTATDASGNQSVCTFPVVVMPSIRQEDEPPVPRSR